MGIVVHIVDAARPGDFTRFEQNSTRSKGDLVIKLGPMCNGVGQALEDVRRRTRPNSIDALIVCGHGPDEGGAIGVSLGDDAGLGGRFLLERTALTPNLLTDPAIGKSLSAVRDRFSKKGLVFLHGCHVAKGPEGEKLIKGLALQLGRDVVGSDRYQIVGRSDFVGEVVVASPSGRLSRGQADNGSHTLFERGMVYGSDAYLWIKDLINRARYFTGNLLRSSRSSSGSSSLPSTPSSAPTPSPSPSPSGPSLGGLT